MRQELLMKGYKEVDFSGGKQHSAFILNKEINFDFSNYSSKDYKIVNKLKF